MKILQRYLIMQLVRNLALCLMVVVFLFLVFDFFDRIDKVLSQDTDLATIAMYFLYKVPLTISLMLPVAMMASILFTIGIMSKNSEITAMRATGMTIFWIARPLFLMGLLASFFAIVLNETIVPYCQTRSQEIYNIDIKQKDKSGSYSQSNIWWRSQNSFYSIGSFDSRSNMLRDISVFEIKDDFTVQRRMDALQGSWIDPLLGWNLSGVTEFDFGASENISIKKFRTLPLPIKAAPKDFYDVKTRPNTMSYAQLRQFIRAQAANGLDVSGYLANLYEKMSFPFINLIVTLIVLPFALRPARAGSMAGSVMAGLIIGFSYYAVHSFSVALGRAELLPPMLSAWSANIIMGFIGVVLLLGAESPT